MARARDTDVKVFDGDVESLSSAETEGVGVRVVHDHRVSDRLGDTRDRRLVEDDIHLSRFRGEAPHPRKVSEADS